MPKILVLKLGALGDVVMATAIIRRLQVHHEGDRLTVLTSSPYRDIFSDWPGIETVSFPRKGLAAAIKTVAWIRGQGFDQVYDLQSNDRSRIYCALSGIPVRVGNHPAIPYTVHPPDPYTGNCHIFERMNQVLAAADVSAAEESVYLPVNEASKQLVCDWLEHQELMDHSFAIMHAGASHRHPEKCWPYYGELARRLEERNIRTVWIGGKDDRVNNRSLAQSRGIDASGVFSINQLAELARHARFAVTNDSGPMHALSGSGIPVFAFFGPTNWRRNHALGQKPYVMTRQADDVTGKKIMGPESNLENIACEQVIERLQGHNLLG